MTSAFQSNFYYRSGEGIGGIAGGIVSFILLLCLAYCLATKKVSPN